MPRKPELQDKVIKYISSHRDKNRYEIADDLNEKHQQISKAVVVLEKKGYVYKTEDGKAPTGHVKYIYDLTEMGIGRALILGVNMKSVFSNFPEYQLFPELFKAISETEKITGQPFPAEAIRRAATIHASIADEYLTRNELYSIVHGAIYGYVFSIMKNRKSSKKKVDKVQKVWTDVQKSLEETVSVLFPSN